ncbi:calcium-binding protein [Conexibacter stalactiti]|uniref:Calcium-binding protein n=1 Tax=Conexibacter stalactiti TaxID=1940611 RepID=A0ABU4HXQ7_9ACTN|nr:calcium-binding protein [Conexibacter stalactiti]MDW5598112.1 calcium-binding protein [Conexibacter stalactiti]MEC5038754.1 calcium-binding protein [Conexibacter stalactiti]
MRRTSAKHVLFTLLVGLVALLAGASAAQAGSLAKEGDTWVFRAGPENNNFIVSGDDLRAGYLMFSDTHAFAATLPDGCYRAPFEADDATTARCEVANVRAELGDNPASQIEWGISSWDLPTNITVTIDGGPGNDRLTADNVGPGVTLLGAGGNDEIVGGGGNDVVDGGPGNDNLDGGGANDTVRGGEGDDELRGDGLGIAADVIDGGPGYDTINKDWSTQRTGSAGLLAVSLDGVANDGIPNEGDNVVGVERFDMNQPVALVTGAEAIYFRTIGHGPGSSKMIGGPAGDTLVAYDYADEIDGAGGNDTIEGGYGDDKITGGPGQDTINAEAGPNSCNFLVCRQGVGNDTVYIRDGEPDSVVCGVGTDTVIADAIDTVAPDCENVDKPVVVQPPRRDPRTPPNRSPTRRCVVPKVKAGSTFAAAKKALTKKGCKAASKKVRSVKVKKGRVVKLSQKAGKKLAYKKTITVYVSRGRR